MSVVVACLSLQQATIRLSIWAWQTILCLLQRSSNVCAGDYKHAICEIPA